jgi:cell division protein FtsB
MTTIKIPKTLLYDLRPEFLYFYLKVFVIPAVKENKIIKSYKLDYKYINHSQAGFYRIIKKLLSLQVIKKLDKDKYFICEEQEFIEIEIENIVLLYYFYYFDYRKFALKLYLILLHFSNLNKSEENKLSLKNQYYLMENLKTNIKQFNNSLEYLKKQGFIDYRVSENKDLFFKITR